MLKPHEYLMGKGRIERHEEETDCAHCREALWDRDSTWDIYSCTVDESSMIGRCCCKSCAIAYIEKLGDL